MKALNCFLLILAVILIVLTGAVWYLKGVRQSLDAKKYLWGVAIRPYAFNTPTAPEQTSQAACKAVDDQLSFAQELGATGIRILLEEDDRVNDCMVEKTWERGMVAYLGVEEQNIDFKNSTEDLYKKGYDLALKYSTRYVGKVPYYQLANEVSGTAVHKSEDGRDPTLPNRYNLSYDKKKYEHLRDYVKGLADGIAAGDPKAKRIITGNWVLTDIVKYMANDGVNFEIIGWDWYSDMGDNYESRPMSEGPAFDLTAFAKEMGKELWLVEVNRNGGSFQGKEKDQADYITKMAEKAWEGAKVKGFFVHPLPDIAEEQAVSIGHLGLVGIRQKADGSWEFAQKKPAYRAYQTVIKDHPYQPGTALSFWEKWALKLPL